MPTKANERLKKIMSDLYDSSRTLIQGVLNVTPDSFSDGGKYVDLAVAVQRAKQMVAEGADWIDIGGESTRPGSLPVDEAEELRRVLPVLEAVRKEVDVPITIDTYKSEVARQALALGADIINDVWAMKRDPRMLDIAVHSGQPIILGHNRTQEMPIGLDVEQVVCDDLVKIVEYGLANGLKKEQIILDPGIGFGFKDTNDNLRMMAHLDQLVAYGYPVLLGTSRKKFIRETLQRDADHVLEGTAATVSIGIWQGCRIVRVHDISEVFRTVQMIDAIRLNA